MVAFLQSISDTTSTTIMEVYVTYKTAKLLYKQGFNEPCRCIYDTNNIKAVSEMDYDVTNSDLDLRENVCYLAPTQALVMKWLREKHQIIISPKPNSFFCGEKCRSWSYDIWAGDNFEEYSKDYPTYEDAVEGAIKYCLTTENYIKE